MELIDKWEFTAIALDKNIETFVIHFTTLSVALTLAIQIYLSCYG